MAVHYQKIINHPLPLCLQVKNIHLQWLKMDYNFPHFKTSFVNTFFFLCIFPFDLYMKVQVCSISFRRHYHIFVLHKLSQVCIYLLLLFPEK